jgi:hypothetical protein
VSARRAFQLAEITRELRADDWWPRETYLCGCVPTAICVDHDRLRAHERTLAEAKKTCTRCGEASASFCEDWNCHEGWS